MCRCRPHRAAGVTLIFIASTAESEDSPTAALSNAGILYSLNFSFFQRSFLFAGIARAAAHARLKDQQPAGETRSAAELRHPEMMMFIGV